MFKISITKEIGVTQNGLKLKFEDSSIPNIPVLKYALNAYEDFTNLTIYIDLISAKNSGFVALQDRLISIDNSMPDILIDSYSVNDDIVKIVIPITNSTINSGFFEDRKGIEIIKR